MLYLISFKARSLRVELSETNPDEIQKNEIFSVILKIEKPITGLVELQNYKKEIFDEARVKYMDEYQIYDDTIDPLNPFDIISFSKFE